MPDVTLTWSAPTTGSVPAGYKFYRGTAPGVYGPARDMGNPPVLTTTETVPNYGVTYYMAVTAYAANGSESLYSNEVNVNIPNPTPNPPVNLVVTGTS